MEAPSADKVRVIETEDGETWVNLDDMITVVDFSKETLAKEIAIDISQAEGFEEKNDIRSAADAQERMLETILETLEDIKSSSGNE